MKEILHFAGRFAKNYKRDRFADIKEKEYAYI
ncbi:hypothetical protein N510_002991 [Firmicutes bacterium ASF500]|nr:hypothetical protein N510_002991 [Firmicutes bacterium ASF500]